MWIFDRLTVRIFAIFLLTIAFFLSLVMALPELDSRNLTYLANKDRESGNLLANAIEKDLTKIPKDSFRWWMRFIVVMDNHQKTGQQLFIVTPNQQIITADTQNIDLVKNRMMLMILLSKFMITKKLLGLSCCIMLMKNINYIYCNLHQIFSHNLLT